MAWVVGREEASVQTCWFRIRKDSVKIMPKKYECCGLYIMASVIRLSACPKSLRFEWCKTILQLPWRIFQDAAYLEFIPTACGAILFCTRLMRALYVCKEVEGSASIQNWVSLIHAKWSSARCPFRVGRGIRPRRMVQNAFWRNAVFKIKDHKFLVSYVNALLH